MSRFACILLALSVAACGVERPLIKPADIPKYEAARQRKRDQAAQDEIELQQKNAADAAADAAAAKALQGTP